MIQVSGKHGVVGVPARPEILNVFPDTKVMQAGGRNIALLRHGADETRFLRNLGYDVPAPVLHQYDWEGGTPFDVQRKTAALLTLNQRAYVLNGMGTGKTKAALWSWRFLNLKGEAGKLLVAAPLSTLNFTWAKEVFETLPGVKVVTLHGNKAKRLKRLADPDADVFVINHDGLGVIKDALVARTDIDTLVIDELAVFRNATATRTKTLKKVVGTMKWVWGMTGSPTPNAPTDAWAQCALLTPHTVPKYFTRFRDDVMTKISQFRYVPKQDAVETVFKAMQPSVRYTLDDVVELPELIERSIPVAMGEKQERVYTEMENKARVMVQSQEITAMNAGAVLNKLLQISCGYVYTREGEVVPLDNENRLTALVDAVNSTDRKVIVFVPFVHALDGVKAKLTSEGYDVRAVSGATPRGDRDRIFNLFQNTDKVKVLVAHPACMAHGLTLTAADTVIWFAPLANLELFEQANARIRRVGQKHKQQVLMFYATAAEKKMYAKLRAKQKVQNALLEMFEEATTA